MSKNVRINMDMDYPLPRARQRTILLVKKLKFNLVQTTFLFTVFAVVLWVHHCVVVALLKEKSQRLKDNNSNYPLQKGLPKWLEHYDYYMMPFPLLSVLVALLAQAYKFLTIHDLVHSVTSKDIHWCVRMTKRLEDVKFWELILVYDFLCYLVESTPVAFFHGILAFTMCLVMFVDYYYVRLDVNYFIDEMDCGGAPCCESPWWMLARVGVCLIVIYLLYFLCLFLLSLK